MTREVAEKIARGITDKIECNTADIDDWANFWGFTREEYEEFLNMAIEAQEQQPKIKVLDRDEVARKLGTVDIYKASRWVTLLRDLEYLGMKICEVKK